MKARSAPANCLLDFVIQLGIDVGTTDLSGSQALHYASFVNEDSVQRLTHAGADVHCKNLEGRTPLHSAARARQANTLGLLCDLYKEKSQHVKRADIFGRSALHDAARSWRQESVSILLEYGADSAINDKEERTPLDACAEYAEESILWNILNKEKRSRRSFETTREEEQFLF